MYNSNLFCVSACVRNFVRLVEKLKLNDSKFHNVWDKDMICHDFLI